MAQQQQTPRRTFIIQFSLMALVISLYCLTSQPAQAQQVRITNFNDFAFGSVNASSTQILSDDLCVYRSVTAGYRIRARGNGASFAFTLANGARTLPYQVWFNNNSGTTGAVQLTTNVERSFTINNNSGQTCPGGLNANLQIRILQSSLQAARSGTYTGRVTVRMNRTP